MSIAEMDEGRRGGGHALFWMPIILILFVGVSFSILAYMQGPSLSIAEALATGFGGLAGLIAGLLAAGIAIIVGLFAALIGLVAAGGAIAMTLFVVFSPIIVIVLLIMLLRRPRRGDCPDPSAH